MAKSALKNAGKPKDWEETVSLFQEYLWAQGKAEQTGHINFVGEFNVDLHRKPPFRLAA